MPKRNAFTVAVAPLRSNRVQYFQEFALPLFITNTAKSDVLLERVTLSFQSDADQRVYHDHDCGIRIHPKEAKEIKVSVNPDPAYLANTNIYEVGLTFRTIKKNSLGEAVTERHQPGEYLIIVLPNPDLGQIFISFKQPEDQDLANALERYAKRAGFTVYMAVNDPQPGTDLWRRIEPELRKSIATFVIWTQRT